MNKFEEQQQVRCISDDFPHQKQHGGTEGEATHKPKVGEVLIIDEILGEYLRFDHYDTPETHQWWHHTRFEPIGEKEKAIREALQKPELILTP